MLRCEKYRRKVDESYGKIGKSYCGEWDYLCVRRGQYLLSGFTIARRNKL